MIVLNLIKVRCSVALVLIFIIAAWAPFFPLVLDRMTSNRMPILDFPRYAVTTFAVSTDVIEQEAQLLEKVGAHNITIVYRELQSDKIELIREKLKKYGDLMIPELSYMQRLEPRRRADVVDAWFGALRSVTGRTPEGFFSFQADTFTANYAHDRYNVSFVIGNLWDTVNLDFISARGGLALPYYASRRHSLIPASDLADSSVLMIQPFAIAPTGRYHYDNNHIVDLSLQGIGLGEFKYVNLNYPFFTPLFLELDWVIKLNSTDAIENTIQGYQWVYRTFKVIGAKEFSVAFRSTFPTTPDYHFIYKSSDSTLFPETAGQSIEWLMTSQFRIARVGNRVISALSYDYQESDRYLLRHKAINLSGFRFGEDQDNIIDTSLRFDIDDLWQHEYGDRTLRRTRDVTYTGSLHDFYSGPSEQ